MAIHWFYFHFNFSSYRFDWVWFNSLIKNNEDAVCTCWILEKLDDYGPATIFESFLYLRSEIQDENFHTCMHWERERGRESWRESLKACSKANFFIAHYSKKETRNQVLSLFYLALILSIVFVWSRSCLVPSFFDENIACSDYFKMLMFWACHLAWTSQLEY